MGVGVRWVVVGGGAQNSTPALGARAITIKNYSMVACNLSHKILGLGSTLGWAFFYLRYLVECHLLYIALLKGP